MQDVTNDDQGVHLEEGESSAPPPAENETPDDKGEEEIEEYGSRTDD